MGKWDKNRRKDLEKDTEEEATMISLHHIDLYDQGLLDLKQLVNRRKQTHPKNHKAYDIAIDAMIRELHELGNTELPMKDIDNDINEALKGGKYKKIYWNPEDDNENDVIQIRAKKIIKAKPKRKPVKKVVRKCKCK